KVGEWVVTPRRGKAVEINALWYNALRLLEGWLVSRGDEATGRNLHEHADLALTSFNKRFWYAEGGYLYDVVDGESGDDSACRPNQIFAIALRHPVLASEHWALVLDTVRKRLLTPVGLRTLSPGYPDYKPRYDGDLRARDAAYHQGTVWPWLLGAFVDAWLRVRANSDGARHEARARFLVPLIRHYESSAPGHVAEVADGDAPHAPRGCPFQAWSVGEALRLSQDVLRVDVDGAASPPASAALARAG